MRKAKPLDSILEAIGDTPVVRLGRIVPDDAAAVYAKIESLNPMGSVKDRIAKGMIDDAERHGIIHEGTTIIEPTSGNTGISLAAMARVRGHHMRAVVPNKVPLEKKIMLKIVGAELDQGLEPQAAIEMDMQIGLGQTSDQFVGKTPAARTSSHHTSCAHTTAQAGEITQSSWLWES